MISELALWSGLCYGTYKLGHYYELNRWKTKRLRGDVKTFEKICLNMENIFTPIDGAVTDYGSKLIISLEGKLYSNLEKMKELMEIEFKSPIKLVQNENKCTATLSIIRRKLNDGEFKFKPMVCKPNELFVSYDDSLKPIVLDMYKKPHVLVTGSTNSGKSWEIKSIITNLIYNNIITKAKDLEIYFSNVSCSADYRNFLKCKCVNGYVETFEESLDLFNDIMHTYEKRLSLFNKLDVGDIKEYNKKVNSEKKMSIIYLVIDEFADFFPSNKLDNYYEIKVKCYNVLKEIVRKVRKCGIFLILGIQRPDTTVLDPSLKSNITTKIAFSQENVPSSLVACDSNELANIPERECLIMSGAIREWSRSLYFTEEMLKEYIKDSIVPTRKTEDDYNKFLKKDNKPTNSKDDLKLGSKTDNKSKNKIVSKKEGSKNKPIVTNHVVKNVSCTSGNFNYEKQGNQMCISMKERVV